MPAPLGPDFDFQAALVELLRADTTVASLVGARIYQDVPLPPVFPYVTVGDGQNVPDLRQFLSASEVFLDFHVWSRTPGRGEAKKIGSAVERALEAEGGINLTENRCLLVERHGAQYLGDPDGITTHGVVTMRGLVEPTT